MYKRFICNKHKVTISSLNTSYKEMMFVLNEAKIQSHNIVRLIDMAYKQSL